ncbi:MAG: hypothetical protein ACTSVI_09200 [Promethearchaeota archaeon]
MPQRVYVKGKKTHAKGESFKKDSVGTEKERYQVSVDLISLKTLKDYDTFGWAGEFYFKVDGDKAFKARWPNKGEIKLQRNQEFTAKSDMSLWSEFRTVKTGEKSTIKLTVYLREMDHLKKDQLIAKETFEIKLPQKTSYIILQDKKEQTKAKLRIMSVKTRY